MTHVKLIALLLVFFAGSARSQQWLQSPGPGNGVTFSPVTDDRGFIYVFSHGVLRSTDDGLTWERMPLDLPDLSEVEMRQYQILVCHNGNLLCVQTALPRKQGGIWRSTDAGEHWTQILSSCLITGAICTPKVILVPAFKDDSSINAKLLRSTDYGDHWDSIACPSKVDVREPSALHLSADSGGSLFLSADLLWKSIDSGMSWNKIRNFSPTVGTPENAPLPLRDGSLIMSASGIVYKSLDTGRSWTGTGLRHSLGATSINKAGEIIVECGEKIYLLSEDGTMLSETPFNKNVDTHAGCEITSSMDGKFWMNRSLGLYELDLTRDTSWMQHHLPDATVNAIIAHPSGKLIASSTARTLKATYSNYFLWGSSNGGNTWERLYGDSALDLETQCLAMDSTHAILAGGRMYVYRSTDLGISWQSPATSITDDHISSLAVQSNGTIYAGTEADGVYRSTDRGETWDQVNSGLDYEDTIASLAVKGESTVFAAVGADVYVSNDKGQHWTCTPFAFLTGSKKTAGPITVTPEGNILAAAGDGSLWLSKDDGVFWTRFDDGIVTSKIRTILPTPSGSMIAATSTGIYTLPRGADRWQTFSDGLTQRSILSLGIDPSGFIYAGSIGSGVFRSKEAAGRLSVSVIANDLALGDAVPNPFAGETSISYDLKAAGRVSLVVYNLLGQEVSRPVDGFQTVGSHRVQFDASNLAPGRYVYILRSPSGSATKRLTVIR